MTNANPPFPAEWSIKSLIDKDPFPAYEELRKGGPLFWDSGFKCWVVLSYDLCRTVEFDEGTYRALPPMDEPPVSFEIKGDPGRTAVSVLTGEEHARMRRFYLKFLNTSLMPEYRAEHVLPVINHIIDRFAEEGSAELGSQFADEVTVRVMASLFGLPWKDDALMADMSRYNDDIIASFTMRFADDEANGPALRASAELNKILLPLILGRKRARGSDFISQIWTRAEEEFRDTDVDHIIGIVRDIALGAGDTTKNAIANLIYMFLSDRAVREIVTKDQEGPLNVLVEETLRLVGPLPWRFRKANRDVSLAGVTVKKDDKLCLLHAAAGRDPDHYSCPHMLDLNRKRPTDHLQFSVGSRICPGMHLARLLMRESVKALIARFPNLRLDPAKEPPSFRGLSPRSFRPLQVRF
ncbi:cytochrome P450 [Bradyrhizobium sp. 164]|uniref:cytochrome P450 n=1 Tax=Bradyrhizobium sp. 164 TaxID=2782637 RepID=UPI001FF8A059|nr:cytochrome P450 [Bradyrhizobium sp. 164]MCK1596004.1 cytochrome P450 [Bradyrhizobium sp. 164]